MLSVKPWVKKMINFIKQALHAISFWRIFFMRFYMTVFGPSTIHVHPYLLPISVASYYTIWVKTSWTYSIH